MHIRQLIRRRPICLRHVFLYEGNCCCFNLLIIINRSSGVEVGYHYRRGRSEETVSLFIDGTSVRGWWHWTDYYFLSTYTYVTSVWPALQHYHLNANICIDYRGACCDELWLLSIPINLEEESFFWPPHDDEDCVRIHVIRCLSGELSV